MQPGLSLTLEKKVGLKQPKCQIKSSAGLQKTGLELSSPQWNPNSKEVHTLFYLLELAPPLPPPSELSMSMATSFLLSILVVLLQVTQVEPWPLLASKGVHGKKPANDERCEIAQTIRFAGGGTFVQYCTMFVPNCQSMTKVEVAQENFNGFLQNGGRPENFLKTSAPIPLIKQQF